MDTDTKQLCFFDGQFDSRINTTHLSSGFPEKMVILDCETTGGKATFHRIIEIGLIVVEHGRIVETWESLIQPDQSVPEAITRLTGINTAMLENAPRFADIAALLLDKLQARRFVAHNARFDYGFIKNEFSRIGIPFNAQTLCSVKFSRLLYPQFNRHGLDQIIKRFGFNISHRHRAFDDAAMVYEFFLESSRLFAKEDIESICTEIAKRPTLPSKLKRKDIDTLPSAPGVYYFFGEHQELLYVGKSINIRQRVLNHFSQDYKNPKDLRMSARIANVSFERTVGDFSAQLLESQQIKQLGPVFNRRLRKTKKLFGLSIDLNPEGYAIPLIKERETHKADEPQFGLFRTRLQVTNKLEQLADEFQLCHRLLGLEPTSQHNKSPCFRFQLKKCAGACCGKEDCDSYNPRLYRALANYQTQVWPWRDAVLVEETGAGQESALHLVNQWVYLAKLQLPNDIYDYGFGFARDREQHFDTANTALCSANGTTPVAEHFDLDTYFILVRFLLKPETMHLNGLKIHPLKKLDN